MSAARVPLVASLLALLPSCAAPSTADDEPASFRTVPLSTSWASARRVLRPAIRVALDSMNGLEPGELAEPQVLTELRALAGLGLEDAIADGATALLETEAGASALTYVVRCALPQGTVVEAPDGQTFEGHVGLAHAWLDAPLDALADDGRASRWVSACMLAHANLGGVSVPIGVGGDHPALRGEGDAGDGAFALEEGAFWGELFDGEAEAHSCRSPDSIGRSNADLASRWCARSEACGFDYLGVCEEAMLPEEVLVTFLH